MTTDEAGAPPRNRSGGRRIGPLVGRIAFGVIAGVLVLAVAVAFFVVWTLQRSFPQTSGEIELDGLQAEVTVQRDASGIPTITADSSYDLFYAEGFVHAQDRFFEMDFRRHVTSGRVSEMFGESQVATDMFLRTLGWRATAEEEVAAMDETTLGYYQAYADGVNAYLATRSGAELSLEYAVLGFQNPDYEVEPWEPADSVAWLKAMAWDLRTNVEDEADRALLAAEADDGSDPATTQELLEKLYPDYPYGQNPVIVPEISTVTEAGAQTDADTAAYPDEDAAEAQQSVTTVEWREVSGVVEAVSLLVGDVGEGIGSNSWVVSGSLTESGMPLLANDPHLGSSLPSVWYQVQLKCSEVTEECPFDVGGFSFSGLPGVIIGHNAQIAWGFTNLTTDVADLYVEVVDGDSYWRDGELVPLEVREETIEVAGGEDVTLTVRETVHGPIISGLSDDFAAIADDPVVGTGDTVLPLDGAAEVPEGEYAVSLRWTALDAGTTATAIFALSTAQDFDGFRYAASLFDVPAQNLLYADVEGNIGYQTPGRLPIRGAGDGWLPQPGWDSAYDWTGYIPFEELPVSYNPASGYIVTANNAIVTDEDGHFLSRDWDQGYRAARIAYLIERRAAAAPLTAQDMREIQMDDEMWIGKKLATAMGDVEVDDEGTQEALALLRTWDAQSSSSSAAAAYANVLWSNLVQNILTTRYESASIDDQSRLFTVVGAMLDDPEDPLWTNEEIGVDGMDEMLALSAEQAYDELVGLQGNVVSRWSWGDLHAITLTHETFGSSGIAPIEWLFNRGPYRVSGGASVVNATGWELGESYATTTVPSMRMVVDLSDFDASTWIQLTGASGHAFDEHYTDQTEDWASGVQRDWAFTADAVDEATVDTLVLVPAG